jgi:hypothetical protein
MSTTQISIINFPNPQNIEEIAKWHNLFSTPTVFDKPHLAKDAPPIEKDPLPIGVTALEAIMSADNATFDPVWQPFTEEELIAGAQKYWAYLDTPGVFDMGRTLIHHAMSFCYKRPLTRCELILTMKCEYLANFRMQAMSVMFDPLKLFCDKPHKCNKEGGNPCVCSAISFS